MNRISRKMKWSTAGLVFLAFAAIAATVSINASSYPYNQVVAAQNMSAYEMAELRIAGLAGLAGMYRVTHGIASLPVGSRIKVTWGDGSVEEAAVTCLSGIPCVQPLPGTQKPPSGGGGGGGGMEDGGPGGGFGGPDCSVRPRTGTACTEANGIRRCETFDDTMVDCGFG
ncbi:MULTISPECIES: hypothetical protein [Stenotrophomonas]|uniref:Uncharacterized protein n=1 Tax=Stenotrophomonas geniculata TaxID=86188 RepID=A0ABW1N561_9GAMM|nr:MULTISPECIES: hypothetical protein [Stenotrophomonas]MBH1657348.1 hypothetical protein [Stenotrophomonas maltophilia]MBH1845796.1 hypothetical protein [Stenotrophomonas maltophilia]MCI1066690.1 hypothetical protein [Stenotrophomonas maltophilia]MCI1091853.1 hypothetical protein [Stenotrophomonas maltophilia]MCI1107810.1 hypothetical protein [Stenotrophomonas maltophilia]